MNNSVCRIVEIIKPDGVFTIELVPLLLGSSFLSVEISSKVNVMLKVSTSLIILS